MISLTTCSSSEKARALLFAGLRAGKITTVKTVRPAHEVALHAAAKLHVNPLTTLVAYAFMKGRQAVNKTALKSATNEREALSALDNAPVAVRQALEERLPKALRQIVLSGGKTGVALMKRALRTAELKTLAPKKPTAPMVPTAVSGLEFNVDDPNAVDWADRHAAELIDGITETTREDIAEAVATAVEDGDLESAYEDILAAVGDTARAELIARTEIMTAVNEGHRQAWGQAIDAGSIQGQDVVREWVATDSACPACEELDGEQVGIDESYPGDGGDGPPLHPNCNCTENISVIAGGEVTVSSNDGNDEE